jgi:hypothetical protein
MIDYNSLFTVFFQKDFVMPKPLFRWTQGPCLPQGLEVLAESIKRTTEVLGIDRFDWIICYNGLSEKSVDFIKSAISNKPITLFEQDWHMSPIDDICQSPRRPDGSFEWNGNKCGGSMWKVTPPRFRLDSHEIVCDNDIVILKNIPEIDQFLKATDRALILEEPIRFYGRYDHLFGAGAPFLNSGLMGFPPGYDFAAAIRRVWESNGKLKNISQADEQGLLTYALSRIPSYRIKTTQMKEVLARDFKERITGEETALHFTQSNRIPLHRAWKDYQVLANE